MPKFGPIHRRHLIVSLRKLGFQGPYSGGRHEFMQRENLVLTIPNPHRRDIGARLLKMILRQAGVSRADWERV